MLDAYTQLDVLLDKAAFVTMNTRLQRFSNSDDLSMHPVLTAGDRRDIPGAPGASAPGAATTSASASSSTSGSTGASAAIPAAIAVAVFIAVGLLVRWVYLRLVRNAESSQSDGSSKHPGHPTLWDVSLISPKRDTHPAEAKWQNLMPISTTHITIKSENSGDSVSRQRPVSGESQSTSSSMYIFSKQKARQQAEGQLQIAVAIAMPHRRSCEGAGPSEDEKNDDEHPELCLGFTNVLWSSAEHDALR
ncbi:hypothetical protein SCP_0510050 [Sparassis crispa]|uniref:Uncharacterized protein n=1 Tax=Sparassis crispa TaxID=139825 RepID=A0A401GP07_9APHY|nr:hypothetical protein SCP_0510050 [Sparassis crispa]GBE83946.1 hypothetical protein SCP_0510050 [Sparassis crispa]